MLKGFSFGYQAVMSLCSIHYVYSFVIWKLPKIKSLYPVGNQQNQPKAQNQPKVQIMLS